MNTNEHTVSTSPVSSGQFAPTCWTRVLQARGESAAAQAALSELCATYWQPVFSFIRRDGRDEETARDLTQEFFARLLARRGLDTVEPGRGRFRSFLLGALKHFLADYHDHANAAKRGGGYAQISIQGGCCADTTGELQISDPTSPVSDAVFDRQWAMNLVERAVGRLAANFAAEGKQAQFDTLKPWLLGEIESLSQADAARQLGLTEGAVKVAVHRLRRRFRELVKAEIVQTVSREEEVRDELRYLVEILSQQP
jgi:RNA polymerase sigma-70 factor (ECF subfamily)